MTAQDIIKWAATQTPDRYGIVVDLGDYFSREQVEEWRRQLRKLFRAGQKNISGNYRTGYEMEFNDCAVGVTNGRGRFRVYWRPRPKKQPIEQAYEIPFQGEPVAVPEALGECGL